MGKALTNWLIILTVSGVNVLSIFLVGAATVAINTIGKDLNFKEAELQWPLSVYALAYGCLLLVCGRLADIFGNKFVFLLGSAFFTVASIISAFARNATMFIIFLALQGIGSAANTPAGISIISSYFPPGKLRNQAFTILSAGQPIGFIIGMVLGGVLSNSKATWRAIFYLETGLGVLLCVIGWFVLPKDEEHSRYSLGLDWVGAILSTGGLGLLVYDLSESIATTGAWSKPLVPTLFVVSIVLIISFVFWEIYRERCDQSVLLPMSIWTQPGAKVGPVISLIFFAWTGFNALAYFLALFYQQVQLLNPLQAAIRIIPMGVSGLLINAVLGKVIAIVPSQILVILGLSGSAAACIIFSLMSYTASFWASAFLVAITLPGIDMAYVVSSMQMCAAFPKDSQAIAGSITTVATRLGSSIGLAVTWSVAVSVSDRYARQHPELSRTDPEVVVQGFRAAGWTCLGCLGLSIVIAAVGLYGLGYVGQAMEGETPQGSEAASPVDGRPPALPHAHGNYASDSTIVVSELPLNKEKPTIKESHLKYEVV